MVSDKKIVKRGTFVLIVHFFLFGIVGAHIFTLQVLEAEMLRSYAWREHNALITFSPRRGEILDRRGKVLAFSVPNYSIYYYPVGGEGLDKDKLRKVSEILSMTPEELENRIGEGKRFVWIIRKLPKERAEEIRSKFREMKLRCFGFVEEDRRFYPNDEVASNILGFTGIDDQGLAGIEYVYEDFLKGDKKEVFLRRDAGGGAIPDEKILELPVLVSRREIVLTIDINLQALCEELLKKKVLENKAKGGCLVVLDSKTAEVMAMAVYPPSRDRNAAISWVFEPGSVIKPFVVAAALEEGVAHPNMSFFCPGSITYMGKKIGDTKAHGSLDLSGVVSESCNVGMINLALRMSPEVIYKYFLGFGFGEHTNIDLPGEERGILRAPDQWYGVGRVVVAIGQGISVTGIQLVSAMNVIANKGVLLRPHVVSELRSDGKVVYRVSRKEIRRVISFETAKLVEDMLLSVVEKGTGKKAAIPGVRVAGKTGTAQVPGKEGYRKGEYLSLFLGYFPVESPRWVILIVIDTPMGGEYYGGEVAAPIFSEVGQILLNLYGAGVEN